MSRSRRKTPIIGITGARSEKADKQAWHRRWRRSSKQAEEAPSHRAYSDRWDMAKDGKQYLHDRSMRDRWMRK